MKAIDFALFLLNKINATPLSLIEIQVLLEIAAGRQDTPQIATHQNLNHGSATQAAKRLERLHLIRCLSRTPGLYQLTQDGKNQVAALFPNR